MTRRIAASLALIVFAVCILQGIAAGNPFATVVQRALIAMVGTLVIGAVLGAMAQKMLDENVAAAAAEKSAAKAEISEADSAGNGR